MVILLCLFLVSVATSCDRNDSNPEDTEPKDTSTSLENNEQNDNSSDQDTSNQNSSNLTDNTNQTNQNSSNSTNNNNQFEGIWDDSQPVETIVDYYYKTPYSAHLKVEITGIYDGFFWEKADSTIGKNVILLEGIIKDDLYTTGKELEKTVIIPISIIGSAYEDGDVRNWFSSLSGIYVNLQKRERTYTNFDDASIQIQTEYDRISLAPDDIIPYVDDAVYISLLYDFLDDNHIVHLSPEDVYGTDLLCYDGISCQSFEQNVYDMLTAPDEVREKIWEEIR